jgi:hypothetical protein
MQFFVTTRPPNERQIAMGIRSAKELMKRYQTRGGKSPTLLTRIFASGMLHAMLGSTLAASLFAGVSALFGLRLPL